MDLFLAISQGIGVSLATGVRTFLVPLFVGAMARANAASISSTPATSFWSRCGGSR